MIISELQDDFDKGAISSVQVDQFDDGFIVVATDRAGRPHQIESIDRKTFKRNVRVFKSLDTIDKYLSKIGFRTYTVKR